MVTSPSNSPENIPQGKPNALTAGCTMDNQIAFDVLSNACQATRILGEAPAYSDRLQAMIDRLAPTDGGKER